MTCQFSMNLQTLQIYLFASTEKIVTIPSGLHTRHTYKKCPASSVGAGYQAAFCGGQRNIKLLLVQQKRASHSHWHWHVANDILTASTHHLKGKDNTN